MVVKSQIKFIKNLQQKKYRNEHKLFVVEGIKLVRELLDSDFEVYGIYTTDLGLLQDTEDVEHISESELQKMSGLKSPNKILAVFHFPTERELKVADWTVVLDDVRDPGNLGTIIRLCDWFGIDRLVCSLNTVDCFNPKTLQATMGSVSRVNIIYTDVIQFLKKTEVPVYGAFMDGTTVYKEAFPEKGILVMGNEANGVSAEVEALIAKKIAIPQFGKSNTESLNVATATAILLNEIRRG
ncbi:RNA methyltransferase [Sediminicola sp. YIK13]|uniref:TrmH family RNA methyltransferase n=1 Tax=Sediminicola sp. YIK13 TaxID=1453352 RepID=UPI0007200006|nr:RNA methyltransferase [Sediminicola sp. YIK13]ALM06436.1 RNA methyltransferase [Sediminicola sp. YIK13]